MQGQTGGACVSTPSAAGSTRKGKMTGFTGGSSSGWPAGRRSTQKAVAYFIFSRIWRRRREDAILAMQALAYEQRH